MKKMINMHLFFFEEYENALNFTKRIAYVHPEYKKRPVRKIDLENVSLP